MKNISNREILDRNEFCTEALKAYNLPVSYLIPKPEPHEMTLQEWNTHTSSEHKWEYLNGVPFNDEGERDRVLLGLLYSAGLKHLLEILPQESKEELVKLLKDGNNEK